MEPETKQSNPPVMDVVAPPAAPAESTDKPKAEEPKLDTKVSQEQPKHEPPKEQSKGVGAAIFATVVIVLGLAALAVFAYLQQQ